MIEITYDRAVELAENAITDRGADYVYSNPLEVDGFLPENIAPCLYLHPDGPGCIVGHMLAQVGVDLEGADLNRSGSIYSVIEKGWLPGAKVTRRALVFMGILQQTQDQGDTWGNSLFRAQRAADDTLDDTSWI